MSTLQHPHRGPRIFLTGFSGSGKSAVGRRAAGLLGWEFVDADEALVAQAGRPIDRIFAEDGEEAFRALEREVIAGLAARERIVVSTGGGAMVQDACRSLMLDAGLVVCLDARPETLFARLSAVPVPDGAAETMVRPMVEGGGLARVEGLKRERQWAYALAHWTVPTDALNVEQAAFEVARAWRRFGAAHAWEADPLLAATVTVEQGAYPLFVGWDVLEAGFAERLAACGGANGRAFIISDTHVVHPYARAVQHALHRAGVEMGMFTIPPGEEHKTLATAQVLYEWLAERRVERRDVIIAVGGGVVGDLAGFVAATMLRGVRVVQVPTSLTAMVDSSIGGKTAVDLPAAKNLVGAFHHPLFVFADVAALRTLPERVLTEGWAEALKHGMALDAGLVETYEREADRLLALDPELMTEVVARNAAIKGRIVTEDERETSGRRMLLNYGHTMGHGIEAAAGFHHYLHGEAVAIGMTGAARLGAAHGVTPEHVVARQAALLERYGLPNAYEGVEPETAWEAMGRDKKAAAGRLSWVLLEEVGRAGVYRDVPAELAERTLRELRA